MTPLTILCVTNYGAHSEPFLQAQRDLADRLSAQVVQFDGRGARCLEDVHDEALEECAPGYILRLDDDELPSKEMAEWLLGGRYRLADHWSFARLNFWPDEHHFIVSHNLWPDVQTRLSVKQKAGGRNQIHGASPFGTGHIAPCAIEHWKFLSRPLDERRELVERYETIAPGAGEQFRPFSTPEDIDCVLTAGSGLATLRQTFDVVPFVTRARANPRSVVEFARWDRGIPSHWLYTTVDEAVAVASCLTTLRGPRHDAALASLLAMPQEGG